LGVRVGDTGPTLADLTRALPVTALDLPPLAAEAWAARFDGPALAQVRRVRVESFGPENLQPLARSRHLTGLTDLDLYTDNEGVSAAELELVAAAPFAAGLRRLTLTLADDEAAAELTGFPGLTRLDLNLGALHPGHASAEEVAAAETFAARTLDRLARSPALAGLEEFALSGSWPTTDAAAAIGGWRHLRELTVWDELPCDAAAGWAMPALEDLTLKPSGPLAPLLGWPGLSRLRHLRLLDPPDAPPDLLALADRLDWRRSG
jgi:hypothetical protein